MSSCASAASVRIPILLCALLLLFAAPRISAQTAPKVDIELLINRGQLPEATTALSAFDQRTRADTARALYFRGRIALAQGKLPQGVTALEHSVRVNPTSGAAQYWLAVAYVRTSLGKNKVQQAFYARRVRTALERATHYEPKLVDARLYLIQYYLRAPFVLGGSRDKARAQADTIYQIDRMSGHMARAQVAEATGDQAGAETNFKATVEQFPTNQAGYYALGGYYRRVKKYPAAVDVFTRLQKLEPDQAQPHLQIGRTIVEWGQQLDRGEQELHKALSMNLGYADAASANYHLGLIYDKRGDRARARQYYGKALSLDPSMEHAVEARRSVQPD